LKITLMVKGTKNMIVEGESGGDPEDAVVAAGDRSEFLESGRGSPCGAKERSVAQARR